jgi:hypothetical protein
MRADLRKEFLEEKSFWEDEDNDQALHPEPNVKLVQEYARLSESLRFRPGSGSLSSTV